MLLSEAIDQAATGALRRAAQAHGLLVDDLATRAELAERLTARLRDADYLRQRLAELPAAEQLVLRTAAESGGEIRGFLVGRILNLDPGEPPRSLLEPLLLVRTFAPLGPHRGEVFAVPDEIRALLTPEAGAGNAATGQPPHAPTADPPEREDRRASDPTFSIFALASLLQRQAQPGTDRTPSARTAQLRSEVSAWSEEPGGWQWQDRWAFLKHLLDAAGLLQRQDEQREPAPALAELLDDRPRLRLRLWSTYLRDRNWPDLERAEVPHATELQTQVDLPSLRAAVARELARLLPDGWTTLVDLDAAVQRTAPSILREQLDTRGAALRDPATGGLLLAEGTWPRVEGRWLRYLLLGPLYWLGIVATDAVGERVSLTATGRALLGNGEPEPPRPSDALRWQGLACTASARVALGTLLKVEPYLALTERGPVSRYTLDQQTLGAGLLSGGSVASATRLLSALSGGTLPDDVASALHDWAEAFGRLVIRPGVLLEAREAADLDAALRLPAVQRRIRGRLGPTVAEVAGTEAGEVINALRQAGQLPRVDAALQLLSGRHAYQALVDEQVLRVLFTSLLAIQHLAPEELARLEGGAALLRRLEHTFPPEDAERLRAHAADLARALTAGSQLSPEPRTKGQTREREVRRGRRASG